MSRTSPTPPVPRPPDPPGPPPRNRWRDWRRPGAEQEAGRYKIGVKYEGRIVYDVTVHSDVFAAM